MEKEVGFVKIQQTFGLKANNLSTSQHFLPFTTSQTELSDL